MGARSTRSTVFLPLAAALALVAVGLATAATPTPAVANRLKAQLSAAQEVPAPLGPVTGTGRFDGLLVRTGPGEVRVPNKLPPGCRVIIPPPRSMMPARIVCDEGRLVLPLRRAPTIRWTLAWRLTFSDLSEPATAAHIHLGARGQPGPVAITLCGPCSSVVRGVVSVAGKQARALLGGATYVNVHTVKNPNGEIRGQIVSVQPRASERSS